MRGFLAEGRGWLSNLLAATAAVETGTRAKALNWAGILAWKQGDYPAAQALFAESLAIWRHLGDRRGIGKVLNNQGLLAYEQGDYRAARALHEESLGIDRELGDRWGVAVSLIHLDILAMVQGDYPSARAVPRRALCSSGSSATAGIANAIRSLGSLCSQTGDHPAARAHYEESLRFAASWAIGRGSPGRCTGSA